VKRLLVIAAALIVYGSLFPWHFDWQRAPEGPLDIVLHSWPDRFDRFLLRDIALNILLYMPLGLAAYLSVARRSRALAFSIAVLCGLALSAAMETLQVYVPGRQPSLLDITTNTIGTAAGALTALLFLPAIESLLERGRRSRPAAAALLLIAWGTCQLYPFFPDISHHKLHDDAAAFAHGFPLSGVELWANNAEWFAAFLAMRAVFGRLRLSWHGCAMAILGVRLFVATRTETLNEVIGAVIALALWLVIADGRRTRAGLCFLSLAIVLRELAPFRFTADAAHFTWIPFVPTFTSEWQSAVVVLARKAFDYGAMVWLLRRAGIRYAVGAPCVAAALFVCELAQTHLPGRTPEITDSVLTLVMALVLWRLETVNPLTPVRTSAT
jgi:VanZ family protein